MGDRISMSISSDSPSDETLNGVPLALLLRWQYEFPFGINIVQFSFFFQPYSFFITLENKKTHEKWKKEMKIIKIYVNKS